MKVAITGHDGFLGKHLLQDMPKAIDIKTFNYKRNNLFDVESLKRFVQADAIVHLAGANRDTDSNLIKVNTYGTAVLMEAIKMYNPKARIIFASSYQVYYDNSLYGHSKKSAEEIIRLATLHSAVKGTVLRISNIYGSGGRPFYNSVIATFFHLIKEGKQLQINGDGNSKRDYIYVKDVAHAIIQAVLYKQEEPFEIFPVGSGKAASLKKIIKILAKYSSQNVSVVYNKSESPDPGLVLKSIARTIRELQWKPKYTLEEGLRSILHET